MSGIQRAWRFDRVTGPAVEPLTVAQVQAHCRIDDGDPQLALIPLIISATRAYAEKITNRSFLLQSWLATGDQFPGYNIAPLVGSYTQIPLQPRPPEIVLAHGPVVAVTSVKYLDTTGVQQTLDPSTYVLDASGLSPRIAPAYGKQWPSTLMQIGGVQVAYNAGLGTGALADSALVAENVRQWMLIRIATAYEHREEVEQVARGRLEPLAYVDSLLDLEREWAI
jgi:uncharacterized phiE125 gp8 family phage protein